MPITMLASIKSARLMQRRIGGGRGVESRGDRASLRERADEGMAGGRKAANFDLKERPCHQGALGAPSADPTVLVFALVGHDGEARCDEEN